jgi:hypothetical protein
MRLRAAHRHGADYNNAPSRLYFTPVARCSVNFAGARGARFALAILIPSPRLAFGAPLALRLLLASHPPPPRPPPCLHSALITHTSRRLSRAVLAPPAHPAPAPMSYAASGAAAFTGAGAASGPGARVPAMEYICAGQCSSLWLSWQQRERGARRQESRRAGEKQGERECPPPSPSSLPTHTHGAARRNSEGGAFSLPTWQPRAGGCMG